MNNQQSELQAVIAALSAITEDERSKSAQDSAAMGAALIEAEVNESHATDWMLLALLVVVVVGLLIDAAYQWRML